MVTSNNGLHTVKCSRVYQFIDKFRNRCLIAKVLVDHFRSRCSDQCKDCQELLCKTQSHRKKFLTEKLKATAYVKFQYHIKPHLRRILMIHFHDKNTDKRCGVITLQILNMSEIFAFIFDSVVVHNYSIYALKQHWISSVELLYESD